MDLKRWLCGLLAVLTAASMTVCAAGEQGKSQGEALANTPPPPARQETEKGEGAGTTSYREYMEAYAGQRAIDAEIPVNITRFEGSAAAVTQDGREAVRIREDEQASWRIEVETPGMYQIRLLYQALPGKDMDMECALLLDGSYPFSSASAIALTRIWTDSDEASYQDGSGNEYRAVQEEVFAWQHAYLKPRDEYLDSGCRFYFSAGSHTITLQGVRESLLVGGLTLCNASSTPSYQEVMEAYAQKGLRPGNTGAKPLYVEGEGALHKSHSTLYAQSDGSSCQNSPYSVSRLLLNTVGGESWSSAGEWLEWTFQVETSGFYEIGFRAKQNFKSGSYSTRRLLIDGRAPFAEAEAIRFRYDLGWRLTVLGEDTPQYVYLEAGKHTLRLEVVYGELADICRQVQAHISEMNALYRDIMMITGSNPDTLRDYRLESLIPGLADTCSRLSRELYQVIDKLTELTGGKGAETAVLEKTALQLSDFAKDPERIPNRLSNFSTNISSLAAWLMTAAQQPLLLDYVLFNPPGEELPAVDAPWYRAAYNEILRFFYSFVEDYDNIGSSVQSDKQPVTLWLGLGRDQAMVMQSIISNGFTLETGIPLNMRLITMEVLLRAVAAGAGPDLAMYQDQSTVINYALRGALYDLKNFADVDQVLERFLPESTATFALGDCLYALPEQMTCHTMFYRTDILRQLGLQPPDTWDEVYDMLAVLQKNHLELGVLSSFTAAATATASITGVSPLFMTMLYQYGGRVYTDEGDACILNQEKGVRAFTDFCELYTKYGLPLKSDLLTRFRTGEAPVVINAFTFANELSVSAPEISGLWEMALLPGTPQGDGSVDRSTVVSTTGVCMFRSAANLQSTWEFMKWWTDVPAQTEYARQIEASQGRSGRWPSANLKAVEQLGWTKRSFPS